MKTRAERYIKSELRMMRDVPFAVDCEMVEVLEDLKTIIKGEKYGWFFENMDDEELNMVLDGIMLVMGSNKPVTKRVFKFWRHLGDALVGELRERGIADE